MITGAKESKRISDRTKREYYLLMDDGNPIGICTSIESARSCLDVLAREKYGIGKIEGLDAYLYEDSSGVHLLTFRAIPRMKVVR